MTERDEIQHARINLTGRAVSISRLAQLIQYTLLTSEITTILPKQVIKVYKDMCLLEKDIRQVANVVIGIQGDFKPMVGEINDGTSKKETGRT